jgi:acyl-coenzyme A synthetase/AMP-(fatty) acid ligase
MARMSIAPSRWRWRFHPRARLLHLWALGLCQGVRIGTAEIYRAVEKIPEVADSLIVRGELPGGNFFMPLFLVLKDGAQLDEDLQLEITTKLPQYCTPGHVRDRMYRLPASSCM